MIKEQNSKGKKLSTALHNISGLHGICIAGYLSASDLWRNYRRPFVAFHLETDCGMCKKNTYLAVTT